MNNLVSVIIPCFQQGRFLKDAIDSLKLQTHRNWEALIIDDGSTDETEAVSKILVSEDCRIKYVYQENSGVSAARNTGLRLAKGRWIQFLDADDIFEFEKFEQQVKFLDANTNVDIIYSGSKYLQNINHLASNEINSAKTKDDDRFSKYWEKSDPALKKFVNQNILPICGPLIRFDKIKNIEYFNTNLDYLEDWEFWIRCAMLGLNFHYSKFRNSSAIIRVHSSSATNNAEKMRDAQVTLRLWINQNINDNELKNINFSHLIHIIGNIEGKEDRCKYYKKLFQSAYNYDRKILIATSYFLDNGSSLNKLLSKLISKKFQKNIAKAIGRSN